LLCFSELRVEHAGRDLDSLHRHLDRLGSLVLLNGEVFEDPTRVITFRLHVIAVNITVFAVNCTEFKCLIMLLFFRVEGDNVADQAQVVVRGAELDR
jgi:hypothetical protein